MTRNRLLARFCPHDARDVDNAAAQHGTPEYQLLAAVLERAILDLRGIDITQTAEARDAFAWINNSASEAPFTFLWVCQELNLDPAQARRLAQQVFDGERVVAGFYGSRRVPRPHGLTYSRRTKEDIAAELNRQLKLRRDACEADRLKPKTDR